MVELALAVVLLILTVLLFVLWRPARTIVRESILHPKSDSVIEIKDYKVTSRIGEDPKK